MGTKPKTLICVRGIPGSGKTHMARRLTELGVRCVDTDDVVTDAYKAMAKAGTRLSVEDVLEQAQVNMHVVCGEWGEGVMVIVGVTLNVPNPDATLFITMSPRHLALAYERTVRRELKKYASISPQAIGKLRIDQVAPYLACKLHLNAFDPRREFAEYAQMYAAALEFERKSGAELMVPREILAYVRRAKGTKRHK
jgi:hypothetical protein